MTKRKNKKYKEDMFVGLIAQFPLIIKVEADSKQELGLLTELVNTEMSKMFTAYKEKYIYTKPDKDLI